MLNKKLIGAGMIVFGATCTLVGTIAATGGVRTWKGMPDIQAAHVAMGGGLAYMGGAYILGGCSLVKKEFFG